MVEMESITLNQRTFRGYYDALPDRKVSKAPKSAFVDGGERLRSTSHRSVSHAIRREG